MGVFIVKLCGFNIRNNSKEERRIMIEVGKQAPDFELASHLGGTKFTLGQFKGQKNVMLVFYPLDWTPT
jgi:peroxiredoxin